MQKVEVIILPEVLLPNEIIAEVVYVLEKVYNVKNEDICDTLLALFKYKNFTVDDFEVLEEVLLFFILFHSSVWPSACSIRLKMASVVKSFAIVGVDAHLVEV